MTKRNVICLVRLSTEEQAAEGKGGLLRQHADNEQVVSRENFHVLYTVELRGVSGTDTLYHPEMQRILRDLANPEVAGVVCSAVDRIVRPERGSQLGIFDPFQDFGKCIWSANDGMIDPSTDMGFLNTLLLGWKSGSDRKRILSNVNNTKERFRLEGRHTNNDRFLPRGVAYKRDAGGKVGEWSYVEPYASKVRKAYEALFAGESFAEVARIAGYTKSAVKKMLRNPIWIGIRRYEWRASGPKIKSKNGKDFRLHVRRPQPLEIPLPRLQQKPLITPERWHAAQELLMERSHHWTKSHPKRSHEFLAKGIARCGKCGRFYYSWSVKRAGHYYHYYYCSSKQLDGAPCGAPNIRRDVFDPVLRATITDLLAQTKVLQAAIEVEAKASRKAPPKDLDKQIGEKETRLKRAYEWAMRGSIDEEQYLKEKETLSTEIRALEALRPQTPAEIHTRRSVAHQIAGVFAEFDTLPFGRQHALLRRAIKEAIIEDRAMLSITLRGGFLAQFDVKNSPTTMYGGVRIINTPDLVIPFKKPISLEKTA